jgi:hypothetical protein
LLHCVRKADGRQGFFASAKALFAQVKASGAGLITLCAVVIANAVKQSRLFSATASTERQRRLEYSIEQLFF